MPASRGRSPIAHLMWAVAFLAVLAGLFATSRRSDAGARGDGRLILAVALVLFAAYLVLGLRGRRRHALSGRAE